MDEWKDAYKALNVKYVRECAAHQLALKLIELSHARFKEREAELENIINSQKKDCNCKKKTLLQIK